MKYPRIDKNKKVSLRLFDFQKEVTLLNKKALFVEHREGYNSYEILYFGSMSLPRKQKKEIRNFIK